MLGFKDREILSATRRIARGTFVLANMDDKQFTAIYKSMERNKIKSPCKYKIPEWFTIKIVPIEKDKSEFQGSFIEDDGFPIIYKSVFLKELKKYHVYFEETKENAYKIVRKVKA